METRDRDTYGEATFKERVQAFWNWFPKVADQFQKAVANDDTQTVVAQVGEFMAATLPGLSWALGQGENTQHSFTLTGEGQVPLQLLAEYWRCQAPTLPGWTFHASRQASSLDALKEIAIGVSEQEQVDAANFILKTHVDEENQLIDIVAWHPALTGVPKEHHFQILFLLLDETLGEFGTQNWLGEIKVEPFTDMSLTRSLLDLPKFIEQARSYHEWEKLSPLEAYSVYEVPEQSSRPRGDTVVGSSCIPDVIFDYIEHKGHLEENPLQDTGAELLYLAIESGVFPEGAETDTRSQIEDKLDEALAESLSGRTVGGAFGVRSSYIDLLIFDGQRSRKIITETLKKLKLADRVRVLDFA